MTTKQLGGTTSTCIVGGFFSNHCSCTTFFSLIHLTIIHDSFVCVSFCVSVCMCVRTLTNPKPLEVSSQNFQRLIRAPHCMSSQKFCPNRVAMGVVLLMGVVW